ncbi:uncharacterized protein LOC115390697 isoform X2 [Salarias fasciatus]|uniref:uncharacterized protein LOC115390697 isoform X2 n=1 Tax=Salarias fasciatus TaxID=181472 RepID=UPI001176F755|nr:uncharacterized protein LOC115390697 isoform X2 [Salarias fasciatus]
MAEYPKKRPRKSPEVDPTTKKKPGRSAEGLLAKKESDRWRRQTRICIGVAFPRWRALKAEIGLRADTDVALLLLDNFEKYSKGTLSSTPIKTGGNIRPPPPPSLSSNGTESQSPGQRKRSVLQRAAVPAPQALKARWLDFIFKGNVPAATQKTLHVCARHFTPDCFHNQGQYEAGLCKMLRIRRGSIPTIRDNTAAVSSVNHIASLSTRLPSKPRVRNKATQTGPNTPPVSHQSAFQLVYVPVRRSAPPQDSRLTSPPSLAPVEDVESESDDSSTETDGVGGNPTCVVFKSCLRELFQRCPVCERRCEVQRRQLGTCVSFAQLCSHCQYSRRWQSEPLQHRVRNLQSSAEQVKSFMLVHEQEDKTAVAGRLPGLYRCSDPLSDVSVTEQATPQHIVDEDSILQLMKNCPICRKSCRCTKRSRGPYLVVHQNCYFCHYRRKWTSQPEAQLLNVINTEIKRRRKEKAPAEVHLKI